MPEIEFVQFKRPRGERETVRTQVSEDAAAKAAELRAAGYAFEIEVLPTSHVHADVCDDDRQLASFVVENGPRVPPSVEALVLRAHARWDGEGRPKAGESVPESSRPLALDDEATVAAKDAFARMVEKEGGTIVRRLPPGMTFAADALGSDDDE